MSDTERADSDPGTDSWDWITVMQGPDVSGKDRIRFGQWETHEKMNEDAEVYVAAEPLETIPLPRPMTRPEIEEWLKDDDWGQKILEKYDGNNQSSRGHEQ